MNLGRICGRPPPERQQADIVRTHERVLANDPPYPLEWIRSGFELGNGIQQHLQPASREPKKDILFRREISEERSGRHAGGVGDLVHCDLPKTPFGKETPGDLLVFRLELVSPPAPTGFLYVGHNGDCRAIQSVSSWRSAALTFDLLLRLENDDPEQLSEIDILFKMSILFSRRAGGPFGSHDPPFVPREEDESDEIQCIESCTCGSRLWGSHCSRHGWKRVFVCRICGGLCRAGHTSPRHWRACHCWIDH